MVDLWARRGQRPARNHHHYQHSASSDNLLASTTRIKTSSTSSSYSSKQTDESFGTDRNQQNIELRPSRTDDYGGANDEDDDEDGATSPPLWKSTSRSISLPLQHHPRPGYNNSSVLSPTSRSQEIARGRKELMEMIRNMPESSYELSLKDLIEQKESMTTAVDDDNEQEDEYQRDSLSSSSNNNNSFSTSSVISSREMINYDTNKIRILKRNKSLDSNKNTGPFLLKMFLPFSSFESNNKKKQSNGKKMNKNRNSTTSPTNSFKKGTFYAKVSPKPSPQLMEGKRSSGSVDKDWWKKRFSVAGQVGDDGLESIGEGSGSSNSSNGSRKMGGFLSGCWSFKTKKTRTITLK